MNASSEKKSALKLARLHAALYDGCSINVIEKILEQEGDINYAVPDESPNRILTSYATCYTALHFAYRNSNIELFKELLNNGAEFTKQNENGKTVLHMMTGKLEYLKGPLNSPFLNEVLSAHVSLNNFSNPCDTNGISHFHIACMSNNARAVQFFLDNGVSVDEPVGENSKVAPGFTPMHFAAMSANVEIIEILLSHGANTQLTDANGMTPLHLLIECRIHMYDDVHKKGDAYEKLQDQKKENEKIINMLLENMSIDNDCPDNIGLTNFHVACMLQDTSAAQHLIDQVEDINHCVYMDSRLCPGYTALHFAAHVSITTVEMLMKKGADMEVKDSKGLTPLDFCIERYKTEDVCHMMSLNTSWKSIVFSDGRTNLLSFIRALADSKLFKKFAHLLRNLRIPVESRMWPGFTPLHLTVLFAEKLFYKDNEAKKDVDLQIVRFCLKNSTGVTAQDSRGRTALHFAYRLKKMTVVDVILRHCQQIPNISDEDNLSHLHIVCAVSKTKHTFKKCALNGPEVNLAYTGTSPVDVVKPGSTPLHVCVINPVDTEHTRDKIRILLRNGADPYIRDAYGLTPIHWLLPSDRSFYKHEALLKEIFDDCVVEEYGFSYLHVACHQGDETVVRLLLENGADVNLAIKYTRRGDDDPLSFLSHYDKQTPLHISVFRSSDTQKILLEHGADMFAKKADGSMALKDSFVLPQFVSRLQVDVDLQRRTEREFGWSRLHLACYLLQEDGFEGLVQAELEGINAQVFPNSPIWEGYTPLHLLVSRGEHGYQLTEKVDRMMRVLLENGADVTVADSRQNTPVGMLFRPYADKKVLEHAGAVLMNYHRDFNVNPVSDYGVSHFHAACYLNDVETIRGFLLHGVDVNHPVDCFSGWRPGQTPLHLASQYQVVDLLINHGADIHVEDVYGCTVLFEVLKRENFDESVITRIIESGAEINAINFKGQTPFEVAIEEHPITAEKLTFYIRQGFVINSCNPITGVGFLSIVLSRLGRSSDLQIRILDMFMGENSTILGRNTLHHFVTRWLTMTGSDHDVLLDKIIRGGCDIDEQDNGGKTALHIAIDFRNTGAVSGLLRFGADINVVDGNGNSVLSHARSQSKPYSEESISLTNILTIHACRLSLLRLYLSREIADIVLNAPQSLSSFAANPDFQNQIDLCRNMQVGVHSISLHNFLSETGSFTLYRSLNQVDRRKIDHYFDAIDKELYLKEIKGILKLQYRKIINRLKLLPLAIDSFRMLLDFALPDLCAENIFEKLCNDDLKNIINASVENDDRRMDVD